MFLCRDSSQLFQHRAMWQHVLHVNMTGRSVSSMLGKSALKGLNIWFNVNDKHNYTFSTLCTWAFCKSHIPSPSELNYTSNLFVLHWIIIYLCERIWTAISTLMLWGFCVVFSFSFKRHENRTILNLLNKLYSTNHTNNWMQRHTLRAYNSAFKLSRSLRPSMSSVPSPGTKSCWTQTQQ